MWLIEKKGWELVKEPPAERMERKKNCLTG
jgi:hypothetical protein